MVNETYCCEFMEQQLNYHCDLHGADCPTVVIQRARFQGGDGELILIGRNAEYTCNFCPACGTKWPGAKLELGGTRRWGKPI